MWTVNKEHGAIYLPALQIRNAAATDRRRSDTTPANGNLSMKEFNVKYLRTKDPAQVCVRGAGGLKLFEASLPTGQASAS